MHNHRKHVPEEAFGGFDFCYVRICGVVKAHTVKIALAVAVAHCYCMLSCLVAGTSDARDPAFLHIWPRKRKLRILNFGMEITRVHPILYYHNTTVSASGTLLLSQLLKI